MRGVGRTDGLGARTRRLSARLLHPAAALLALDLPQLASAISGLEEKTRELADLTDYYNSMLQAKESSIESLQQLMENQQRAHKEAQVHNGV